MQVVSIENKEALVKISREEVYSIISGLKYEDAHVAEVKNNELIDEFENLFSDMKK
jgi:hypothetical protein